MHKQRAYSIRHVTSGRCYVFRSSKHKTIQMRIFLINFDDEEIQKRDTYFFFVLVSVKKPDRSKNWRERINSKWKCEIFQNRSSKRSVLRQVRLWHRCRYIRRLFRFEYRVPFFTSDYVYPRARYNCRVSAREKERYGQRAARLSQG